MSKSNYLENKLLEHVLKNTSYTSPTTVYAALYTDDPTEADSGTEVTGGSYARQAVAFAAASGGTIANSGTITFANLPSATITHIGIRDASTAGNLLYSVSLSSSVVSVSGTDIIFSAGDITVSED